MNPESERKTERGSERKTERKEGIHSSSHSFFAWPFCYNCQYI
jgi:hypothetical protein